MDLRIETISCIVFDFDGVLIDSNSIKRNAYYEIFKHLPGAAEIIRDQLGSSREWDRFTFVEGVIGALSKCNGLPANSNAAELTREYAEAYGRHCHDRTISCAEIAGAAECLPDFACQWALYINSATPERFLREIVLQRNWSSWFQGVYGGPASKIENLKRIFAERHVGPASVLFVGDGERDRFAADVCGCQFVGVQNADNDFEVTPRVLVANLHELSRLLKPTAHA